MLRFGCRPEDEFRIVNVGVAEPTSKGKSAKKPKTSLLRRNFIPSLPSSLSSQVVEPAWVDEDDSIPSESPHHPGIFSLNAKNFDAASKSLDLNAPGEDLAVQCFSKILSDDKTHYLPDGKTIDIHRVRDANRERKSVGSITAVHFNPAYQMSLTASADTTLAFFKVDGTENALLRDRIFQQYPLSSAKFTPLGDRVVLTGNRNSFRLYDLQTGEEVRASPFLGSGFDEVLIKCELTVKQPNLVALGTNDRQVYLVDLRSLEKTTVLRTKGVLQSFCFSNDGAFMITFDASGSVYIFDLRERRPHMIHQWVDQACTGGRTIVTSADGRWIACGSDCGYVNIYSCSQTMLHLSPEPDKCVGNLRTAIDLIAFHPVSEMLCFGSSQKSSALRLYHVHGRQVFQNFPVTLGRMDHPSSIAFSPSGGYLCVGQRNGRATLYHIPHYGDY